MLERFNIGEISPLLLLPNFSPEGQEILQLTADEAIRLHHDRISDIHLWLAISNSKSPFAKDLLTRGIDLTRARAHIESLTKYGIALPPDKFELETNFKEVLVLAFEKSKEENAENIAPVHLFKALARQKYYIANVFLMDVLFVKVDERHSRASIKAFDFFKELLGSDNPSIEHINMIMSIARKVQ